MLKGINKCDTKQDKYGYGWSTHLCIHMPNNPNVVWSISGAPLSQHRSSLQCECSDVQKISKLELLIYRKYRNFCWEIRNDSVGEWMHGVPTSILQKSKASKMCVMHGDHEVGVHMHHVFNGSLTHSFSKRDSKTAQYYGSECPFYYSYLGFSVSCWNSVVISWRWFCEQVHEQLSSSLP